MRRLRALLPFAVRRARIGCDALGERAPTLDRMGRRRFLGALVAAPIAAPAAVRTLSAPLFATLGVDVQRSGGLTGAARYFDHAGTHVSLLSTPSGLYPTDLSGQTYADVAVARLQERATWAALGLDRLPMISAAPFIDDAGSGP